MQQDLKLF
jgi:hypothetical protein